VFGDAIRGALATVGCTSCTAYDAAAVSGWVQVTATEYAAVADTANIIGANKSGASDTNMAVTYSNCCNGMGVSFTMGTAGTPVPASTYIIGYSVKTSTSTYNNTNPVIGHNVKVGTNASGIGNYTMYGNVFPNFPGGPPGVATRFYFVNKWPSGTTGATVTYLAYFSGSSGNFDPGRYSDGNIYSEWGNVFSISGGSYGGPYSAQMQTIGTTTK
jgi:hypothetical protein